MAGNLISGIFRSLSGHGTVKANSNSPYRKATSPHGSHFIPQPQTSTPKSVSFQSLTAMGTPTRSQVDLQHLNFPRPVTAFTSFKLNNSALATMKTAEGPSGVFYKANKLAKENGFASVIETASGRQFALVHQMTFKQAQAFQRETGLDLPLHSLRTIKLGQGGLGKVRLALNITDNTWCAVKKMTDTDSVKQEIANLQLAKDIPNVIRFIDSAEITYTFDTKKIQETGSETRHYIFMSLAPGKNGLSAAQTRKNRDTIDAELLQWAKDYAQILADFHEKGIAHQDVKPHNFVHTDTGIKIVDMGFATHDAQTLNPHAENCGTDGYTPPSHHQKALYAIDQDCFGLGVSLLCLKHGKSAAQFIGTPPELELYNTRLKKKSMLPVQFRQGQCWGVELSQDYDRTTFDGMVAGLLEANPQKRMSAQEALAGLKALPKSK